ncbi:hypothetical protein [Actinomadura parmotrematis]|uniref:Uncharacterized protein n=1 Tax=Actinomadura parmotrematis TaxID=2864039 RepID=A0ABS7G3B8_9ACTN|nr:hypothetical protein [Actinomadura parmotrematis]MBW8486143.1 hypothetical protein [Actinomadura parmotrematis]
MNEIYGARRLADRLGLAPWQFRLAREHDLIPPPDPATGRWTGSAADRFADRAADIVGRFGDVPPIGAEKAAQRLAARVRTDVERSDIEVLVARGDLAVAGTYQSNPVYLLRDIDDLDGETVTEVVGARKGPLLDTVNAAGAARILAWPKALFERVADERGLAVDQLGRYSSAEVRALADNSELRARVTEEHRAIALTKAREREGQCTRILREWLICCTAYLETTVDEPPEISEGRRALRALTGARSELRELLTDPPP